MKNVMTNIVSKETSDKYSGMCSDIAELFKKYEKDFETKRVRILVNSSFIFG